MLKLNLGCGKEKIEGCVNIDVEPSCNPDLVLDFIRDPLPYKEDEVDRIYLFHVIEHIPEVFHEKLLEEIRRVLKWDGKVYIAYPEFTECAKNYMENKQGKKEFWKNTIYGRQLYPSDFHVALMDTPDFIYLLRKVGFDHIIHKPETNEPYNTLVCCMKGEPMMSYEDVLAKEIFGA